MKRPGLLPKEIVYTTLGIISLVIFLFSCQPPQKALTKSWQGFDIDFTQLKEITNVYHMFDSTNTKVGSMVFSFAFENGFLVCRDTSRFDNGSVFETVEITFDTASFQMKNLALDMQTRRANLDIDLAVAKDQIKGAYVVKQDTLSTTYEIDSAYQHSAFREEIYMFTHALNLKLKDTLAIEALVATSMTVSKGRLIYTGEEKVETINGPQMCDVLWLEADGKMPNNRIWVSQSTPRTIMKFYVPGPELNITLVAQR